MTNLDIFSLDQLSRRKFLELVVCSNFITNLPMSWEEHNIRSLNSPMSLPYEDISNIPLEVKIGQMLIIGFRGVEVTEAHPIVADVKNNHIGGVVLFDYDVESHKNKRNIQSPSQLKELISKLQSFSSHTLLICIDYEGGKVTNLKEHYGFPHTESAQYLGGLPPQKTYNQAIRMAKTLSELGINVNFAPVIDINSNPNNPIIGKYGRSFSSTPSIVTEHALAFINAHQQYNMKCTLKHFPGHGSSKTDSHLGFVDVTKSWSEFELEPYKSIISQGVADMVMTAHLVNRKLEPSKIPATFSYKIITQLLRNKLGFNGVVISDDLQMKAISSFYNLETTVKKSLEAGVDILLFSNNGGKFEENIATQVVSIIKRLIDSSSISESRIDESYRRIAKLKQA